MKLNSAVNGIAGITAAGSLLAFLGPASCSEKSKLEEVRPGPHVAWQVPINHGNLDWSWSGVPLLAEGRFVFAEGSNITALDAKNGARLWSTTIRNNPAALTSKILAHGQKIYLPDNPDVFCLDARTGEILWRFAPDSDASVGQAAVDDHAMYIGTRGHKVYALDLNDGHPIWSVDVGLGWPYSGMVQGLSLASDTLYVGVTHWIAANGYLQSAVIVALDRATGRQLWKFEGQGNQNGIVATPVVAGNNLIVDDAIFGAVFAVDRFTGKEVWRRPAAPGGYGPMDSPIIVGDTAFIASADTHFYALDSRTGHAIWNSVGRGGSFSAGVVCGSYAMGNAQGLDVFDRRTGRTVSSLLGAVGPERAFPTSRFSTDGKRAYITGILWAWAIDCQAGQD